MKNKEYARLVAACKEGNVADVETFLAKGRAEVNRRDDEDWTPLFWACFNGHLDIVKLLVNAGAAVQLMDKQGRSPLYLSSGWGGEEITNFLLQHNGDVTACNQDGWNCLHLCAYRGKDSVVELVLGAGCSLVQKDKQGRTPYDIAKKGSHKKVEEVLLRNAKRAILKGAEDGDHALVNGLLELYKIDVDYADVTGWTPLHYAAKGGRVGIVKLLYSHGCAMDLKNRAGKTALDVAEYGNDAVKTTLSKLMQEKAQKEKSQIMMAREDVELMERKKALQDSVDLRARSSTAAPVRPKSGSLKSELSIPAFDKTLVEQKLKDEDNSGTVTTDSEAEASASEDAPTTPKTDDSSEGAKKEAKVHPKEEGARLNEVLEQMKQAKAARQAKMAEQKKALMASLSEEQREALASRRDSSPSSPKGVVLSPRLLIYDKEAMAEQEAREKKEKEEREAREAAEAAAKAEAEEQARIKAEEEARARQEDPFVQKVLAAEWTDIESMLDAFEVPYNDTLSTRLLHLAQFELNAEWELYKLPEVEVKEEDMEDTTVEGGNAEEGAAEAVEGEAFAAGRGAEGAGPSGEDGESSAKESETVGETEAFNVPEGAKVGEESTDDSPMEPGNEAAQGIGAEEEREDSGNEAPKEETVSEAPKATGAAEKADVGEAAALSAPVVADETPVEPLSQGEEVPREIVRATVAENVSDGGEPAKEDSPVETEEVATADGAPGAHADSSAVAPPEGLPEEASPSDTAAVGELAMEEPTVVSALVDTPPADAIADTSCGADIVATQEEAELQRLLETYGEEGEDDAHVTDDLLDHFDDLLADLEASTAGLELDVDLV